jgi:hypothetical protein
VISITRCSRPALAARVNNPPNGRDQLRARIGAGPADGAAFGALRLDSGRAVVSEITARGGAHLGLWLVGSASDSGCGCHAFVTKLKQRCPIRSMDVQRQVAKLPNPPLA